MENWNHVCFACRIAVRRPAMASGRVRCPHCGDACGTIGCEVPVPAKRNVRAWRKLEQSHTRWGSKFDYRFSIGRRRFVEKRIAELSQYGVSEAIEAELEELQRELEAFKARMR